MGLGWPRGYPAWTGRGVDFYANFSKTCADSELFAILLSSLSRYSRLRDGPSYKPPFMCVGSVRWFGDEPAFSGQGFGCVDRGFWVPEGGGAKLPDIFHPDDVFIPALDEPV